MGVWLFRACLSGLDRCAQDSDLHLQQRRGEHRFSASALEAYLLFLLSILVLVRAVSITVSPERSQHTRFPLE
jgi:hypothetical protein